MIRSAAGGMLLIDDAHDLAPSQDPGDESIGRVTNLLLTETQRTRGQTVVVLAGLKEGLKKYIGSDYGLESRFQFHVHIDNYSPAQMVQIMEQHTVVAGYQFEAGLVPRLQKHLEDGADVEGGGNALLGMVERAIQSNRNRMFLRWRDEQSSEQSDSKELVAADFRIGIKLAADEELKSQIDQEVDELIGMDDAKTWFGL